MDFKSTFRSTLPVAGNRSSSIMYVTHVTHVKIYHKYTPKTTSQRFPQWYPPRICDQSWNWSRNKKVENILFAFQTFLNTIDLEMNITKEVINTLPNYHKKEFMIHWKKNPTSHNPSVHQNPFFSLFEPSLEVISHYMECTWVKHTQPSNTPTCTLQLSCNITKETHLSSCCQTMFSFFDTSKLSQFSSDHAPRNSHSCRYATSKFHKLSIYPEQIACSITNHPNITLK